MPTRLLAGDNLGVVEPLLDPEDADGEVVPEAGEEDVHVLPALGAVAHPVSLEAQHHHVGRQLNKKGAKFSLLLIEIVKSFEFISQDVKLILIK